MILANGRGERRVPALPFAVAVAALLVLLDVIGLRIPPVRVAAGLFLVAWAPGAALLELARPRFLAPSARAVIAVPISLSLAAVIGVVLDRTPIGIQPAPMAIAALCLTAAMLAVAWWRGRSDAGRGPTPRTAAGRPRWPDSRGTLSPDEPPAVDAPVGVDTQAWRDPAAKQEEPSADPAVALYPTAAPEPKVMASARARVSPRTRADAMAVADAIASARARAMTRARADARARAEARERAEAAARADWTAPPAAPRRTSTFQSAAPAPSLRGLPLPTWTTAAIVHLRDPLFLNAYALGLSGVLTSGLGVVYWAVAARLYPADVVGINASLLSLITLLTNVSQLNLRSGFGRFVPVAGARVQRLVLAGYLAATLLALVTGVAVVALLAVAPSLLAGVRLTPVLAWLFPLSVVLWTVFTVQDHVLIGFRRSAIVPVENGVFAFAKILLLIPLAGAATTYGILISWTLPTALGALIVTGWILVRLVPRAQAAAGVPTAGHRAADPDGLSAGAPEAAVTPGRIVRYVAGDYLGSLFAIGSSSILPVLVLGVLGAASSAHFYMVGMIATATQLVPAVLATSLLVEVSSGRATFEEDGVRVTRQLALLLGPIAVFLVVFADPVLRIFGPAYAADGATALRLLALAGIPWAVINLAFIRLRLEQRVRWVVVAQVMLAVLLVVPVVVVLPAWGITGVGIVTLVSQSLVAAVLGWSELRTVLPAAAGLRIGRPKA